MQIITINIMDKIFGKFIKNSTKIYIHNNRLRAKEKVENKIILEPLYKTEFNIFFSCKRKWANVRNNYIKNSPFITNITASMFFYIPRHISPTH